MSTQGTLSVSAQGTQGTLPCEHKNEQGTLAREHVSAMAREHVFSTRGTQFSRLIWS